MKKIVLASACAQFKTLDECEGFSYLYYNQDGPQHLCIHHCNTAMSFYAFSSHISMLH